MLTLIDEYSRQCLAILPARALKSEDVLEVVKQAAREHGAPGNGVSLFFEQEGAGQRDGGLDGLYGALRRHGDWPGD